MGKIELSYTTLENVLNLLFEDWTMTTGEDVNGEPQHMILTGPPKIERKYYKRLNRLVKSYKDDLEAKDFDGIPS